MDEIKYNYVDFGELLDWPSYVRLAKEPSAIRFSKKELNMIEVYSKFVPKYPEVKCESLEFLYHCLKCVCAINTELVEDLVNSSWRGPVWASWLALITPYENDCFYLALSRVRKQVPEYHWIIDLALESYLGHSSSHELVTIANKYKSYLSMMPKIDVPMRLWPSEEEETIYYARCDMVKVVYKEKGTNAALSYLNKTKKFEWELSYKEWRVSTASS